MVVHRKRWIIIRVDYEPHSKVAVEQLTDSDLYVNLRDVTEKLFGPGQYSNLVVKLHKELDLAVVQCPMADYPRVRTAITLLTKANNNNTSIALTCLAVHRCARAHKLAFLKLVKLHIKRNPKRRHELQELAYKIAST